MYAVIETGGKQYRVEVGTELQVELIDAKAGDTVSLDRVLLVTDGETTTIGRPIVADASVSAEVLRQERGEKVISFKYRPKARRRVKKGHRQEFHVLRIADIVLNGHSAAKVVEQAKSQAQFERERLEEAARRQAAEDAVFSAKLAERAAGSAKVAGSAAKPAPDAAEGAVPAAKRRAPGKAEPVAKPTATKTKAAAKTKAATKTKAAEAPPRAKGAGKTAADAAAADAAAEPKKRRTTKKDE